MSFAPAQPDRFSPLRRFVALAWRYGTSAIGPVSVSASHFIASLLFLHALSPADFGSFSFLLIVVPFGTSIAGALVGVPASNALDHLGEIDPGKLSAFRKMALLLTIAAFAVITMMMYFSEGHWYIAMLLGLYGAIMALRWSARSFAFATNRINNAILSDVIYSALLISGLVLLSVTGNLFTASAGIVMFLAAAAAMTGIWKTLSVRSITHLA